jgi:N-acetyl-anhydromuramyl-L-alanine amidase AmpD
MNLLLLSSCNSGQGNNEFKIISRNTWNALELSSSTALYKYNKPMKEVLARIIIHHSAFSDQPGPKFLQEYQMLRMRYDDIAYHYIIGKRGEIYEGRPIEYMGAHAGETREANDLANRMRLGLIEENLEEAMRLDPDYGSIGICLDGNFENDEPGEEQLQSLSGLIEHLQQKYSIEKNQIYMHSEVAEEIIVKSGLTPVGEKTVCPGRTGSKLIKTTIIKKAESD